MDKRRQVITRDAELEASPILGVERRPHEDRFLLQMQLLWLERRRILRIALAAAVLTAVITLLMHNTYQSMTRIMPPEKQGSSGMAALAGLALGMKGGGGSMGGSDLGMLAGDLLGSQGSGALFSGMLRSRTAQEKVVDQFDLRSVYGIPLLHIRSLREDAIKTLDSNTEVNEDRKSGIISITVTDKDPKRAAAIAKAYIDELNTLVSTLSTSAAGRERVFLEGELVKVKKDLDDADRELSEFASKNATLDPTGQGKAMVEAAATLEGQLIAAQSELRGLQAIYTDNNVRVRTLQARIAELKKQLSDEAGGGLDPSSSAEDGTNSSLGFPSIRRLPLLSYTYANLYRRARIEETVFGVLTQQYESAKVQEAKEIPTVRVLDEPNVPEKKYGPHRVLWILLGAVLGLLAGCIWVTGDDRWRKRDEDDPYKVLFTDVGQTVRKQPVWRKSEAGLRRAVEISRSRIPGAFRPWSGKDGNGNGTGTNGSGSNGSGENGSGH